MDVISNDIKIIFSITSIKHKKSRIKWIMIILSNIIILETLLCTINQHRLHSNNFGSFIRSVSTIISILVLTINGVLILKSKLHHTKRIDNTGKKEYYSNINDH